MPTLRPRTTLALLATLLTAATQAQTPAAPAASAPDAWIAEARGVATAIPPKLLKVLTEAIDKDGPTGALGVCKEAAPKMAAAASQQTGWQIRRVSQGPRNPKAVPDAWELAVLQDFDRRTAAGEPAQTLERAEQVLVDGRPVQRYMRALPTQELCIACHGAADKLAPGVAERLKALYPEDRGTGYGVGQIRGAITLKRPL